MERFYMGYRRREPRRDWGINRGNLFFFCRNPWADPREMGEWGISNQPLCGDGRYDPMYQENIVIVCLLKIVIVDFHHGTPTMTGGIYSICFFFGNPQAKPRQMNLATNNGGCRTNHLWGYKLGT